MSLEPRHGDAMLLRKPIEVLDRRAPQSLLLAEAARPLDELLISGGDGRLGLHAPDQKNSYGCTPFPRPSLLEFGSSTASSISPRAYRSRSGGAVANVDVRRTSRRS